MKSNEEKSIDDKFNSFNSETDDEAKEKATKSQIFSIEDLIFHSKGNLKFQKYIFIGFNIAQLALGMVTISLIFFFFSVEFLCLDENKSNNYF
jgi:hypothetical protein